MRSINFFPGDLHRTIVLLACAICTGLIATPTQAQSLDTAAKYLPNSTLAYVEIQSTDKIIETLLNHPIRKKIEAIPDVQNALKDANMAMAKAALAVFEAQMEETWQQTISTITDGGIYLAFDPKSEGVIVMLKSDNEAKLKKVAGTILNWVSTQSKMAGEKEPFKIESYRQAKIAKFDGAVIARVNKWFLASNKTKLAKQVADNILDGTGKSLQSNSQFKAAAKSRNQQDQIWSYVDLDTVRKSGLAKELFTGKSEDPGAELLFGGLVSTFKDTPFATASARIETSGITVTAAIPHDPSSVETSRQFFFGENSAGRAPQGLRPKNMIANVTSYRDIGLWWLSKEDLFDEDVVAGLAQADSNISTIFGGLDFGQEVLGALHPEMQIVVTQQDYDEDSDMDVKLPAFAIVGKLKDHKKTQRRFKVAYQSVIGFVNLGLGQQGMPQLDLETERRDDMVITSASYLPDDQDESNSMLYNFSPTLAFQNDTMIIASTRDLGEELAELSKSNDSWEDSESHTTISADAGMIKESLVDNREVLITQNMLQKGKDRKESTAEIDLILSVLDFIKDVDVKLDVTSDSIELNLQLGLAASSK